MKRVLILLHIILCTCIVTQAKNYTVSSPDGKIKVTVTAGKQLSWSINYNGERILNPSLMQMDIEGQTEQPGVNPKVIKAKTLKVNSEQTAVIPLKQRIIKDQYNQLTLTCKGNYAIVFRVYNNLKLLLIPKLLNRTGLKGVSYIGQEKRIKNTSHTAKPFLMN